MSDTALAEPVVDDSVETLPRKREKSDSRKKPKRQPPYAVIVYNDEEHTFDYVIEVLQRVCGHPLQKAVELTFRVHNTGRAAVWTGAREVAELKRDQIRGYGPDFFAVNTVRYPLGVSIEPLPGD
ncbi:MAG: ATP-dependent Clp protease adaptor ClpS [Planctomycetes bacterium]|nr:ATP-dependent Clp protease adaptor ClpS [Planctomycetota bacterium]